MCYGHSSKKGHVSHFCHPHCSTVGDECKKEDSNTNCLYDMGAKSLDCHVRDEKEGSSGFESTIRLNSFQCICRHAMHLQTCAKAFAYKRLPVVWIWKHPWICLLLMVMKLKFTKTVDLMQLEVWYFFLSVIWEPWLIFSDRTDCAWKSFELNAIYLWVNY